MLLLVSCFVRNKNRLVANLLGELGKSLGGGTEGNGLASLVEELHEHLLGRLAVLALGLDLGVELLAHVLEHTDDVRLGLGTDGALLLDGVVHLVDVGEELLNESLLVGLTLLLLSLELVVEAVHRELEARHGVLGVLLALLLLLCHLKLHNEGLLLKGLREDSVELDAALALLVEGLGDAKNLVSDLLLAALLGLITTLLLAGEVLTKVDTRLIDLLNDLSLKLLALLALLLNLSSHAGLEVLHVVVELGVEDPM